MGESHQKKCWAEEARNKSIHCMIIFIQRSKLDEPHMPVSGYPGEGVTGRAGEGGFSECWSFCFLTWVLVRSTCPTFEYSLSCASMIFVGSVHKLHFTNNSGRGEKETGRVLVTHRDVCMLHHCLHLNTQQWVAQQVTLLACADSSRHGGVALTEIYLKKRVAYLNAVLTYQFTLTSSIHLTLQIIKSLYRQDM